LSVLESMYEVWTHYEIVSVVLDIFGKWMQISMMISF
jgi:hypothetical protein